VTARADHLGSTPRAHTKLATLALTNFFSDYLLQQKTI